MNEELVLNIAREALTTVLLVAGPILGLGPAVGLVVSIFSGHNPDPGTNPLLYSKDRGGDALHHDLPDLGCSG